MDSKCTFKLGLFGLTPRRNVVPGVSEEPVPPSSSLRYLSEIDIAEIGRKKLVFIEEILT
jgi:hypothetical protein